MKTESKTSRTKFIFSEAKLLFSEQKSYTSRAVFVSFLIPIVVLGVLYATNIITQIIEIHFYIPNPVNTFAVLLLKICACFLITAPLVSEIIVTCHKIAKKETNTPSYYKILYFLFGLITRAMFTVTFFLAFCFSNSISYETASYFCIDDAIVFPGFATVSVILFLFSLYRLTSFSFVFYLFISDSALTLGKAKKLARRTLNGHFCEALIFKARSFLWIFPCIFTLGILSIYFIPRYLVAKALFFRYLYTEKTTNLKKYNSSYIKRTMEVKANEI